MSDKKHIDRLFQEKFKDFEAKPTENVWVGIKSKMAPPKKRRKKIIPLWLRFTGVAAALLLLFTLGNIMFNTKNNTIDNNTTIIVNTENNNTSTNKNISNKKTNIISSKNKNINTNKLIKKETTTGRKNASKTLQKKKINSQIVNAKNVLKEKEINSVTLNSEKRNTLKSISKIVRNKIKTKTNTSLLNNTLANYKTATTTFLEEKNKISNTLVAITINKNEELKELKLMLADSINSAKTIEEALAKMKNTDKKEEENVNKWTIKTNIAPVYYNILGKGSHIHEQFIDNPKNGEINTSYGINVGYALNNKLKIRTGINKLNLSYDTANVIVYQNVTNTSASTPPRNIDFIPTNQGENLAVLSANNLSVQQLNGLLNDRLNAALSQRISYLEVPLELEYAVTNKRFGLNLIGGFSTFILNNNEVVTEVASIKTKIGEANNINSISFSANAGIGIDYKFNKALKFNLEPTFKYQINAYNETSGDFRPYIIGVYTGFSYKF